MGEDCFCPLPQPAVGGKEPHLCPLLQSVWDGETFLQRPYRGRGRLSRAYSDLVGIHGPVLSSLFLRARRPLPHGMSLVSKAGVLYWEQNFPSNSRSSGYLLCLAY